MPTYEFMCPLGHEFEKFEKMSAKGTAKCPVCGKAARRVISGGAGFVFKGSGFYQTDYKNTSASAKAEKAEKGESSGEKTEKPAKSEKAKDEKPASPDKSDKHKAETKPKKAGS